MILQNSIAVSVLLKLKIIKNKCIIFEYLLKKLFKLCNFYLA